MKNPYDKTVFGVAYLGIGKYMARESNKRMTPAYDIWHNVLKRCYARQHKEMFPAYYGICTVCDEWLNFQNFNWDAFINDLKENDNYIILSSGAVVYVNR